MGFDAVSKQLGEKGFRKLTVLYTNDQHSRIEPFPDNDPKFAGKGGFARRTKLIKEIRAKEEHVLLLDAGDIFQGTPYFNFYHGELEYKLMSQMGYDAVTLGNHDFDLGIDNIIQQMPHARFEFINCNYDVSETALHKKLLPYKVFKKGGLRIGVLGVGIELEGLVEKKLYGDTKYSDPVAAANRIAAHLKKELNCDYIICLSHLGYAYDNAKVSDKTLALQSKNIDLIIGGHTHTFLDEPVAAKNADGLEVLITQVGWAGIWLGRLDILFSETNKKVAENSSNQKI
ncbi:MAG: bifunctional metallophosphatase/5'-nucleotidase [Bacteroidia bacterium]